MSNLVSFRNLLVFVCCLTVLVCCGTLAERKLDQLYGQTKEPRSVSVAKTAVNQELRADYLNFVQPIVESRCVVCHGCYDAPCQLKLESPQGLLRGASKEVVYNGARLSPVKVTRLYEDANSTEQWREMGFYSVLNERTPSAQNNKSASILARMLALKKVHPLPADKILGAEFEFGLGKPNECSTLDGMPNYEKRFPFRGMPYALPGLPAAEYQTLDQWLAHGAPVFDKAPVGASIQRAVQKWERLLNGDDLKTQLISRYLYEHLFLNHIYFPESSTQDNTADATPVFFKLVRSSTPPGQSILRIATRRPFDQPSVQRVYYRLWRDPEAALVKTHMPYAFDVERLKRWNKWFFKAEFSVSQLPSYEPAVASNPFISFSQLPIDSRYRFLLDEAKMSIMNFIKGPVCRGQTALSVIQDRFWVYFANPDSMHPESDNKLLVSTADLMHLPVADTSEFGAVTHWSRYEEHQRKYLQERARFNQQRVADTGILDETVIWDGIDDFGEQNDNAALTIYRHFDSASVVKGIVGSEPKTAWIIDYSLLERIHYLLVAGFDVYGNVSHQVTVRMYMDFLRMEGEMNFLSLLPHEIAAQQIAWWYKDVDQRTINYLSGYRNYYSLNTTIAYRSDDPKSELYTRLQKRLQPVLSNERRLAPHSDSIVVESLRKLDSVRGAAASMMPESSVVWVEGEAGVELYTINRTSSHKNISSLFGEQKRRLYNADALSVARGVVTAYPQSLLVVENGKIGQFIEQLSSVNDDESYGFFLDHYAVRRTNNEFWQHSDRLHKVFRQQQPVHAGWLDYNRLENR